MSHDHAKEQRINDLDYERVQVDRMHQTDRIFAVYRQETEQTKAAGYEIKDSGVREEFTSGMVRDTATDKADVELIFNGPMADRWAEHLTKGARKYPDVSLGVPNWTLARGLAELVRFRKSAARHFRQWLRGDVDEDHASAVFFNINGAEYVRERMKADETEDTRGNR